MDMGDSAVVLLAGAEIHGFGTTADLDLNKLMEDATMRWLRPNEVHAILSNYMLFKIQPQPVDNPPSGTVLLFDRKMLRNFRRDGHNWKKKKDGKTVQEAHEKLKIGNEERIHVYYARNEDDPNFYRRCYWLLDRDLERIVLVHYRQTSEETANRPSSLPGEPKEASHSINSPVTPLDSVSGSQSEISGSVVVSEEGHFMIDNGSTTRTLEPTRMVGLDDLEKLDWGDIMEQPVQIDSSFSKNGDFRAASQEMDYQFNDSRSEVTGYQKRMQGDRNVNISNQKKQNMLPFQQVVVSARKKDQESHQLFVHGRKDMAGSLDGNAHHIQSDSGSWNHIGGDSAGIFDGSAMQSLPSGRNGSETIHFMGPTSIIKPAFSINDISTTWAYAGEKTKVIVAGHFSSKQLECSAIFCVFGNECIPAEQIQVGVFRVMALLHEPGVVDFYMTLDGRKPVSDVISFECRQCPSLQTSNAVSSPSIDSPVATFHELDVLKRLSHLLFSTTNPLSSLSSKVPPNSLKEAKQFAKLSSSMLDADWRNYLTQNNTGGSFSSSTFRLLELLLENKLQEWILLKVVEGCRVTPRDREGQGAIHLCSMLDYAWAVRLFAVSGFSLDFRDVHGWTAIHWAAYYGRERTVAALLTAGANPSLVTDPAPGFPGGYTAADLACMQGFEGLGAYLAEKGLQAHYQAMTNSGNASGLQYQATDLAVPNFENSDNFSEQELCLKDSLAAYRNAADAADRIQAAFRERSHKQQMKAAQMENPEVEAASIVAALKIQKAYRDYNRRKMMKAAARIQGVFRTWKARRNFLNLRRQVIKIQALFRGRQARQQYHKFCWSVGVLEKAVLRWRMKRKGLRGLQAELDKTMDVEEDNCVEEEFYRVSREQAEERVQRSVVRVQSMFRSYKAQQEYRRMKLVHNQTQLEYDFLHHGDGFNY